MRKAILTLLCFVMLLPVAAQESTPEPNMLQAGDTRIDDFGIEQVYVPAGCFPMGTSDEQAEYALSLDPPGWAADQLPGEQPQHEVCITEGYWIDKYEVTNAAFQAFADAGGYTNEAYWSEFGWRLFSRKDPETLPLECENGDDPDHPRACITWYEAEAYATWRGGSIPTEAQWEYAARGPESLIYPWGNEWDPEQANVLDSESTVPVGSYPDGASWVGALDMSGNVMEWVQDWLRRDYYEKSDRDNPTGPEDGTRKVERGGWWGSNAFVARATYRHFEDPPTYEDHHVGFRIVSPADSGE